MLFFVLMVNESGQFFDLEIPMADGFVVVVVLQPDEAVGSARLGVDPAGHDFIVEAYGIFLSVANNFKLIPLAQRFGVGF
jgi:hypothetical protein